jgi:hypothetical protein
MADDASTTNIMGFIFLMIDVVEQYKQTKLHALTLE